MTNDLHQQQKAIWQTNRYELLVLHTVRSNVTMWAIMDGYSKNKPTTLASPLNHFKSPREWIFKKPNSNQYLAV